MTAHTSSVHQDHIGYNVGVFGIALVLLWIGIYKYTPTESMLIEPLVLNHFAMGWIYNVLSVQTVSSLIGTIEISVALGLIIGLKKPSVAYYSGIAASLIFITTLSFMLTTPNTWKVSDKVLITNFFLLKDIVFLAISIMVIERNRPQRLEKFHHQPEN